MNAILLATFGYFLISLENVASKFLLGEKIKNWKLYVFYVGLMSFFALLLIPGASFLMTGDWGLIYGGFGNFLISILSGVSFFIYLAFLYKALSCSTASRTYVFSGAVSLAGIYFLARIFLGEVFELSDVVGIVFLLSGGMMIALKINPIRYQRSKRKKIKKFEGFNETFLAGIFFAVSLVLLKIAYDQSGFVNGYVFSRLGIVLATIAAMFFARFRDEIAGQISKENKKEKASQFSAVVLTKILAATGTLMVNGAIFIGSVTLINALQAAQYLFTFILSILLTAAFGKAFAENLSGLNIVYKALGVLMVICGIILVSF